MTHIPAYWLPYAVTLGIILLFAYAMPDLVQWVGWI